jgi:hypothetical protein
VRRTPAAERRAEQSRAHLGTVRRRYKVNVNKRRNLLPGEVEHIGDMVIVLRLSGYSLTQTARTVGISIGQVKEFLADPEISNRLLQIREALPQAALDLLQGYMVEAVQAIVEIMRVSEDDKLVLAAAGEILDRAGLSKASRQERHQINESRTVVTDDGLVEKLRTASPEVQEQAAQMVEQLEKMMSDATPS